MPDITMCRGTECPKKLQCYRFLATPDKYWQSWFTIVPYSEEEKKCYHFWKKKKEKNYEK